MSLVIFGVTFMQNKKVIYALPQLFGIGQASAYRICQQLGIAPQQRIKDLTENQQYGLAKRIKDDFIVEGNLQEQQKQSIQFYIKNGSVRGQRLRSGLPVHGQRTHSNGKTARRRLHLHLNNFFKMDGWVVEDTGLENRHVVMRHHGFESHSVW